MRTSILALTISAPLLATTVGAGGAIDLPAERVRPREPEGLAAPAGRTPVGPALPLVRWPGDVPAADLPVVRTHDYVMSGAVRPLLFWMGRDNIGVGRIIWRGEAGHGSGYELLVGTDPARAPRGINRWGFVAESTQGSTGAVLALMTGSHETSYDAESAAAGQGGDGDFRAIRSLTDADGTTTWQVLRVRTPQALSVHQVAIVLDRMGHTADDGARRQRVAPQGARSGFLVAVAGLLDEATRGAPAQSDKGNRRSVPYVFGAKTYNLSLRRVERTSTSVSGRSVQALHTSFETRAVDTGDTSRFELTTGLTGDLAGVPFLIEWQPRWWLKVSLRLSPA